MVYDPWIDEDQYGGGPSYVAPSLDYGDVSETTHSFVEPPPYVVGNQGTEPYYSGGIAVIDVQVASYEALDSPMVHFQTGEYTAEDQAQDEFVYGIYPEEPGGWGRDSEATDENPWPWSEGWDNLLGDFGDPLMPGEQETVYDFAPFVDTEGNFDWESATPGSSESPGEMFGDVAESIGEFDMSGVISFIIPVMVVMSIFD